MSTWRPTVPARDPLSVHYDGVVHQLVIRAIYAQRQRRGVQAFVASPRAEFRNQDRGGRTKHERAFTRSAYYLVFRVPLNNGVPPAWSLKLTWGDQPQPSSRGRLARPVTVRVYPRSEARVRGASWADGEGFRSSVGDRIDD